MSLTISSCRQGNEQLVLAFTDTPAYELAKAVGREDLNKIEKLVSSNSALLKATNPVNGSNVLVLSIDMGKFNSFEKLLQLGSDPNSINPYSNYSVLINAFRSFGIDFVWGVDNLYIEKLLSYGADPNYAVEESFTNERGNHIVSTSPLMEASRLDYKAVKILIENEADYNKALGKNKSLPIGKALSFRKFDIIDYYIDSLKIDIHQPIRIRSRDSLFIQDYIKKFMGYKEGFEGYEKKQQLIQKLGRMGVDFKNYKYKL